MRYTEFYRANAKLTKKDNLYKKLGQEDKHSTTDTTTNRKTSNYPILLVFAAILILFAYNIKFNNSEIATQSNPTPTKTTKDIPPPSQNPSYSVDNNSNQQPPAKHNESYEQKEEKQSTPLATLPPPPESPARSEEESNDYSSKTIWDEIADLSEDETYQYFRQSATADNKAVFLKYERAKTNKLMVICIQGAVSWGTHAAWDLEIEKFNDTQAFALEACAPFGALVIAQKIQN